MAARLGVHNPRHRGTQMSARGVMLRAMTEADAVVDADDHYPPYCLPAGISADAARAVLSGCERLASRARRMEAEAAWGPVQRDVMLRLANGQACPVGHLADHVGVSPTAMGNVVAGLEQRGWVGVRRDPHDRRRRLVRITDAGERHLEGARAWGLGTLAAVLGAEAPETVHALIGAAERLAVLAARLDRERHIEGL